MEHAEPDQLNSVSSNLRMGAGSPRSAQPVASAQQDSSANHSCLRISNGHHNRMQMQVLMGQHMQESW